MQSSGSRLLIRNLPCSIAMGNDLGKFGAGVVAGVAGVALTGQCLAPEPHKAPEKAPQKEEREELQALHKPTDYDCIILMTSLADFAMKKRIWLLRSISFDFDPQECQDVRIISVVGLFGKGKTFLLNKLFGLRLPSGKTQVTQGLSCVYLKERRMLLIDSPGVQSTVSYRSDSIDRVVDAQTTKAFLFELVSQLSDHIMFVVSDFTQAQEGAPYLEVLIEYQAFQVARPFKPPWLAKPAKVSKRLRRPRTTA